MHMAYTMQRLGTSCIPMQELGLPVGAHIPMLGFIGRLDYQKGVDLIQENHGWLMGEGVQLILLGSGRPDLEQALRSALLCCAAMCCAAYHSAAAARLGSTQTLFLWCQHQYSIQLLL